MNTLSEEDALLFHKLMDSLLLFVNQKTGIIKNAGTMKELHQNVIEKTMLLRKKIFSDKYDFIDRFIKENESNFLPEELRIVASWKKFKTGQFFVMKHTPEFSLFFDPDAEKVYGVKGIGDSFEEKFEGYAPIWVEITLVPFRENIIYDGVFSPFNISFGGNMRKSLKTESEEAIHKFGIITSLDQPVTEKEQDDEEMLRFYMKSSDNKMRYEEEIHRLKKKSKELEALYYREEAREYTRHPRKMLKEFGIKGHFAVLLNSIIASAETEEALTENISRLLPEDKRTWVYTFKL